MNKYIVKKPKSKIVYHDQVCIRCGKKSVYEQNINGSMPRPRPNTTPSRGYSNRFDCLLGSHKFYFLDEVEERK